MKTQYQAIGFAFEGYDRGLSSQIGDVVRGFRSIDDLLPETNRAVEQTSNTLSEMFSQLKTSFEGVKAMAQPAALSTGFEDQITAMDKDLRRLGVNAGYTGKQLSKFKGQAMGMAMGMKISSEEATDAITSWKKGSAELKAVGIDSAATLAKYANVSGMKAGDLRVYLSSLRTEFQFTDKDLNLVASSFMALGEATGHVDEAMASMPKTLDMVRQKAQGFGVKLPSDKLAQFASQTAVLAGALAKVTGNADEAREVAFGFTNTMLKARTNFLDTFAGKGEFSDMFKAVGEGFGDVGMAMDSMNQGPAEFMGVMAKMVLTAKKNQKDISRPLAFVEARFREAFDPAQAAAMTALFRNGNDEVLKSLITTEKATKSLGTYAKAGFTAGWTLSESFERSKDIMETNFRKIGKSAATDFVKRSRTSFAEFNADMAHMASQKGPMGMFITKMSEASHLGGLVFLPEKMRPMGALFGTLNEKMAPIIQSAGHLAQVVVPALTASMLGLRAVLTPKGLLLAGAAGIATYMFAMTKAGAGVKKMLVQLEDTAFGAAEGFASLLEKVPTFIDEAGVMVNKFFDTLYNVADSSESESRWGPVWTRLSKAGVAALKAVGAVIEDLALGFWNTMTGTIDPKVSTTAAGRTGDAIARALIWGVTWAGEKSVELYHALEGFAADTWNGFTGHLGEASREGRVGYKVGVALQEALSAATAMVVDFIQTNPKVGAMAALASGSVLGIGAAAGILAGSAVNSLTGRVSGSQKQLADDAFAEAKKVANYSDAKVQAALEAAVAPTERLYQDLSLGFGTSGKAGRLMVEGMAAQQEELERMLIEASGQNDQGAVSDAKRRMVDLLSYSMRIQDVIAATAKQFDTDQVQATAKVQEALSNGTFFQLLGEIGQSNVDLITKQRKDTESFFSDSFTSLVAMGQETFGYSQEISEKLTENTIHSFSRSASAATDSMETIDLALVATGAQMGLLATLGEKNFASLEGAMAKVKGAAEKNLSWLFGGSGKTKATTEKVDFVSTSEIDKEALKGNVDVIRKATSEVASHLDGPLRKSVEIVLETAFNKAYANIDLGTKKFAVEQSKKLSEIAKTIETKLADAWVHVLEQTSAATKAIAADVVFIQTALMSSQALFQKLMDIRKAAEATDPSAAATTARKAREFDATTEAGKLLEATLWPDWYDDQKKLLKDQFGQLIVAVQKQPISGSGSTIVIPTTTASDRVIKASTKAAKVGGSSYVKTP